MRGSEKEPNQTGSFQVFHDQALAAFSAGRFVEAESQCSKALSLQPMHVGALNLLGQIVLAQNRPSEAAALFVRAVSIEPGRPNLFFNLALVQQAEGRLDEAIKSVVAAIAVDPTVPVLHAKLGQLLGMTSSHQEAEKVLRHALKLDPNSVPVRLNLAQALTDLGQVAEAESLTRAALFLKPKDATAHRLLGRIQQLNGRFEEAAASFETAISLQPSQSAAYFALAYSKRVSSTDRDLIKRMDELVGQSSGSEADKGQLHYALGKSFDDLGEYRLAWEHFDRANRIALGSAIAAGHVFDARTESNRVERLMELFPTGLFSKWRGIGSTSKRPIFIVGMIRSGTTLVEQILARHPDVVAGGELKFWTERGPRMLEEITETAPDLSSWRLAYKAELDRISPSALRITDKMPLNYLALGLIHLAYPDAKIIHCRRDPRDSCLSIYVTPYRKAPEFGHDLQNIAAAYLQYQRLMNHWQSVISDSQLISVDYEALVENPEAEIRRLVDFCDLEWQESCLNPDLTNLPVSTPSQWQVRQPVYRSSVNRWQHYAAYLGPILDLSRNNGDSMNDRTSQRPA
jgi:Flp pilus assembly protein TadD